MNIGDTMKKLKKILVPLFYIICIALLIIYKDSINNFIVENYIYVKNTTQYVSNEYAKRQNYNHLAIKNTFIAKNKDDLLNIIYTIIDGGSTEFTFHCDEDYLECQDDIEFLSNDTNYLTTINNFVHPYNSYNKLYISTNNLGKVSVSLERLYTDSEITYVNDTLQKIESEIITDEMDVISKIRTMHNYIINTTIYDQERADKIKNNIFSTNTMQSHKANGVLSNHIALCSGYTDIMAIYLNRLGIKNFKIANENHIWNALFIEGKWYHLDLTWDDPITSNGQNLLIDDFFLIDDDTLKKKDTVQHIYNQTIYSEMTAN